MFCCHLYSLVQVQLKELRTLEIILIPLYLLDSGCFKKFHHKQRLIGDLIKPRSLQLLFPFILSLKPYSFIIFFFKKSAYKHLDSSLLFLKYSSRQKTLIFITLTIFINWDNVMAFIHQIFHHLCLKDIDLQSNTLHF